VLTLVKKLIRASPLERLQIFRYTCRNTCYHWKQW